MLALLSCACRQYLNLTCSQLSRQWHSPCNVSNDRYDLPLNKTKLYVRAEYIEEITHPSKSCDNINAFFHLALSTSTARPALVLFGSVALFVLFRLFGGWLRHSSIFFSFPLISLALFCTQFCRCCCNMHFLVAFVVLLCLPYPIWSITNRTMTKFVLSTANSSRVFVLGWFAYALI